MSLFSKKTVIALSCATALGALTVAPSLAGVIAPTTKTAVSTESPVESVYHRYGWCRHHHHHWHAYAPVLVYPAYYPYAGWGWGWGAPFPLGGLFPFL
ncbi:hypothetical protein [Methylocystis bryophila]|uniref:Sulfur globule protein n=1 Tax=Methylocystis bryophila TaxID=655015 RepID=A0A1W6MYW8_9HYPH|nr:hypothetical protein [Methylocystis bryophila]ARN82736.1 hypothetical protein B1812_18405 [Methylocystis bryophila]BDV38970.1 hypothetical protein DSM21852_22230 [Methylocystis bryophila]